MCVRSALEDGRRSCCLGVESLSHGCVRGTDGHCEGAEPALRKWRSRGLHVVRWRGPVGGERVGLRSGVSCTVDRNRK